jgi:hypothetical protein
MSKNKKLNKAVRERVNRTGESYTTARMHILAGLNPAEGAVEEGPYLFDYVCHGSDGSPDGYVVPTRFRLPEPVMSCDSCGQFTPVSNLASEKCWFPNCTGTMRLWLHPEKVQVRD